MKKYLLIIIFTSIVGIQQTFAQQILDSLTGKWNVKEYRFNKKTVMNSGTLEFNQSGVYTSNGTYFGTREGLYRTDETRSIVYIDDGKTSEWKATITNNILRLEKVEKKPKKQLVYIVLVRSGKDEINR